MVGVVGSGIVKIGVLLGLVEVVESGIVRLGVLVGLVEVLGGEYLELGRCWVWLRLWSVE